MKSRVYSDWAVTEEIAANVHGSLGLQSAFDTAKCVRGHFQFGDSLVRLSRPCRIRILSEGPALLLTSSAKTALPPLLNEPACSHRKSPQCSGTR